MKLQVDREALLQALKLVKPVVAARSLKPVLRCVLLQSDTAGLQVLGSDLEIWLSTNITQIEVAEHGTACVPADLLWDVCNQAVSQVLHITADADTCEIKGDGESYKLNGQDSADYPLAPPSKVAAREIKAEILRTLAGRTVFAAAHEATRYSINGILWELTDGGVRMSATDGRRLAQSWSGGGDTDTSAIVPLKAMQALSRVLAGVESADVAMDKNHMVVTTPAATMTACLVEGKFPEMKDIIPAKSDIKATMLRHDLLSAIRRASTLASKESKGVRMEFKATGLRLSCRSPERGEAHVACTCQLDGGAITIGFDPGFMLDGLKAMDGERATMEMTQASKPAVFREEGFIYLVMPVSLQ